MTPHNKTVLDTELAKIIFEMDKYDIVKTTISLYYGQNFAGKEFYFAVISCIPV
jgi:hypothetical protein